MEKGPQPPSLAEALQGTGHLDCMVKPLARGPPESGEQTGHVGIRGCPGRLVPALRLHVHHLDHTSAACGGGVREQALGCLMSPFRGATFKPRCGRGGAAPGISREMSIVGVGPTPRPPFLGRGRELMGFPPLSGRAREHLLPAGETMASHPQPGNRKKFGLVFLGCAPLLACVICVVIPTLRGGVLHIERDGDSYRVQFRSGEPVQRQLGSEEEPSGTGGDPSVLVLLVGSTVGIIGLTVVLSRRQSRRLSEIRQFALRRGWQSTRESTAGMPNRIAGRSADGVDGQLEVVEIYPGGGDSSPTVTNRWWTSSASLPDAMVLLLLGGAARQAPTADWREGHLRGVLGLLQPRLQAFVWAELLRVVHRWAVPPAGARPSLRELEAMRPVEAGSEALRAQCFAAATDEAVARSLLSHETEQALLRWVSRYKGPAYAFLWSHGVFLRADYLNAADLDGLVELGVALARTAEEVGHPSAKS